MLQTLNPYTPTAKTAEIMARYRPIAPKPQASNAAGAGTGSNGGGGDEGSGSGATSGSGSCSSPSSMSPTIRQSPYLRNVWPHLQSRPTRTRKRGRTSLGPPPPSPSSFKRPRTLLQGLSPPFHITTTPGSGSRTRTVSVQGFAPTTTLVTLPLLPTHPMQLQGDVIDLNKTADYQIPEEKDFLTQLTKPTTNVISPTPNRLIPSTVSIRGIKPDDTFSLNHITLKKPEEIENELESQPLPAFVSDSNNQVRLVNSSYQEMVGQPDCGWVQSMVAGEVACRSICGKVVLNFGESDDEEVRVCSGGFSCWAKIEWGMEGKKKNLVNAFGEGMRLACESKDYKFAWRFHRRQGGADHQVLQN